MDLALQSSVAGKGGVTVRPRNIICIFFFPVQGTTNFLSVCHLIVVKGRGGKINVSSIMRKHNLSIL